MKKKIVSMIAIVKELEDTPLLKSQINNLLFQKCRRHWLGLNSVLEHSFRFLPKING